jgi:hypothetical protein
MCEPALVKQLFSTLARKFDAVDSDSYREGNGNYSGYSLPFPRPFTSF